MDLKDFSTYFDTNEFLFEEGKNSDHAFIIESGSVEVSHQRGDRKLILSILGEGDVLGEGAVIDKLPSTATARAVEPTRVIAIPVDYIDQKIDAADPTVRLFLRLIMDRYRDMYTRLTHVFEGMSPFDDEPSEIGASTTAELKSVMAQYLDMQQRISTAVNMPAYKDERKSVGEQTLLTTKIQLTEQKSIKSAMTNEEFRLHYQPTVN